MLLDCKQFQYLNSYHSGTSDSNYDNSELQSAIQITKAQYEHRAGGDHVGRDGPRGGDGGLPLRLAVGRPACAPAADPGGPVLAADPVVERLAHGARHRHAQPAAPARNRRQGWRWCRRLPAERRAPASGGGGERMEGPEGARGGE